MSLRHPIIFIAASSVLLSACSGIFENKTIDYKSAQKVPSLEVPPDLTAPARDDRYLVPDMAPSGSATYSAYNAERKDPAAVKSVVEQETDKMRVERAGSQRYLVIQGSLEALYPKIRQFWNDNGFVLSQDAPNLGLMETDWAENRAKLPQDFIRATIGKVFEGIYSVPERDRFRTRLEKGTEPNTMEIYISHRGMAEVYNSTQKDSTVWQWRPADPELEAEMLRRLMVSLGADEARSKQAIASVASTEQAKLVKAGSDQQHLELSDSFDRAWRRVGLALDRIGFVVQDRNRSEGFYYVRYVLPENEQAQKDTGMFSWLAFWRSKPKDEGNEFRIEVKAQGEQSIVNVLNKNGQPEKSESAHQILTLLRDQLK